MRMRNHIALFLALVLLACLAGCGTTPETGAQDSSGGPASSGRPGAADPAGASAQIVYTARTVSLGLNYLTDICEDGDGYRVSSEEGVSILDRDFAVTETNHVMWNPHLIKMCGDSFLTVTMDDIGLESYAVQEDGRGRFSIESPRGFGFKRAQLYCFGEDIYICDGTRIQKNGRTLDLPQEDGFHWDARALVETEAGPCLLMTKFSVRSDEPVSGVLIPVNNADKKVTLDDAAPLPEELLKAWTYCTPESGCVYAEGSLWRAEGDGFTLAVNLRDYGVNPHALIRVLPKASGEILCLQEKGLIVLSPVRSAGTEGTQDGQTFPPERKTLVLGTVGFESVYITEFVSWVNLHGTGCKLSVKLYEDEEQLNRALLTGEVDLLGLQDIIGLKNYAKKGLLQPLEDLAPELFGSGLLYENMLGCLRLDGCCFFLPTVAFPSVCLLPKSYGAAPEELGSLDAFLDLLLLKSPVSYAGQTRETALNNWLNVTMDYWIDEEAGTARFDSDAFLKLLEYCGRFPGTSEEAAAAEDPELDAKLFRMDTTLGYTNEELWRAYDVCRLPIPGLSTVLLNSEFYLAAVRDTDPEAVKGLLELILTDEDWHDFARNQSSRSYLRLLFLNREWTEADLDRTAREEIGNAAAMDAATKAGMMEHVELVRQLFAEANHFCASWMMMDVIDQEASAFFNGDITAAECARRIQNRVEIYLAERG